MGKGVVYIPVYAEDLEVMNESNITAEQLGRAVYAVGEFLESGTRPEVEPDILFAFNLLAKKLEKAQEAYAEKVQIGRESAQRRKREEPAEEAPEEEEKDTEGYPKVPKGTQRQPDNKNKRNNNKNINIKEKEKNKEKERPPRIPPGSGTGPPNEFNYSMRNDDLNKVLMEL